MSGGPEPIAGGEAAPLPPRGTGASAHDDTVPLSPLDPAAPARPSSHADRPGDTP
ncbi:hypothetical protein [Streptomyces sp. NBC_00878]|uniref:hypothetical protein n=1 Tax=Streptomyces sp. NBC_00878 TaxID=2975854 RepID=UPI002252B661|nr:hypothetical protein [Streptomyces sp. NBC_00878]MCX4902968.1 hypothetical protein [Streptomyces sp. NBC_00878]